MIIRKHGYTLDVDLEATLKYSRQHTLCDCDECRNLYAQIADKFPKLKDFLAELGLLIERPDDIGSCAVGDYIDYQFVSYTVTGRMLETDRYEVDLFDGGLFLDIVIDNRYVPNEQKSDEYFTVTVYGINLPWVLDEPFPKNRVTENRTSFIAKIKSLLCRN